MTQTERGLFERIKKVAMLPGNTSECPIVDWTLLRYVCESFEQRLADAGIANTIYWAALNEISGSCWGVPGYQTAEEGAAWMNDRAEKAIAEVLTMFPEETITAPLPEKKA